MIVPDNQMGRTMLCQFSMILLTCAAWFQTSDKWPTKITHVGSCASSNCRSCSLKICCRLWFPHLVLTYLVLDSNVHKPCAKLISQTCTLIYVGSYRRSVGYGNVSTSLLLQHFYEQLRSETITKAEELQSTQKYVKGLTAEYVVRYRNQQLVELGQSENADLAFGFHPGLSQLTGIRYRSSARGDQLSGLPELSSELDCGRPSKLLGHHRRRLRITNLKVQREKAIDYNLHPFEYLYY